ncbi:MAG: polysaccharide biosynthesis tyrosine autokinase [Terracidiphilus sp.]
MSSNASSSSQLGFTPPGSFSAFTPHNADLELRDLVLIFRRRKGIIVAALAVGILLAAVVLLLSQRQYSSTATIEINKENSNELGMADLSGIESGFGGDNEINMQLLTEESVIQSDNTALSVIERLGLEQIPPYAVPPGDDGKNAGLAQEHGLPLDKAPFRRDRILQMFRSRLHVSLVKGTRLIDITYTDTDAARSTAIANAVVEAYINEYTETRYQASSRASSWLTNQLADLKDRVAASQAKVDQFQRESGLTGMTLSPISEKPGETAAVPSSDNVPLERLLELNRDLTNAEVARIANEAAYRLTETQDPDVVMGIGSTSLASSLGPNSPLAPGSSDLTLLQQLRQQQAQLKMQMAASSVKYGDMNPVITQLRNEEQALDAQITQELARIRTLAKNNLELSTLAEQGIQDQVTKQEQSVNTVSEKADELVLLQEEALSSRQIYQDLYTKLEEASVTAGIKASNVTLVNPARISSHPSSPRGRLLLGVGGMLGLVLGLIAAFLWDYFDDSIVSLEQAEQISTLPVLGAIPDFNQKQGAMSRYGFASRSQDPGDAKETCWLLRAPRSHIAEAYRSLRTALLLSRAEKPPKVILVMSGSPGEGKSTTCLNTAAAFAIQGDKVLYIDADMRHSRAQDYFHCANNAGLSNCLTSGVPFEQVLHPYPGIDTLFLLPAGPSPPNPSELVGSRRFVDLLEELKTHFDYIFIDSPPILLVTDAQLLSLRTDGIIAVVRSKKTTKRALQRMLSIMRTPGASPLGIVVNALGSSSASYSGYGYYGKESERYVEGQ